MKKKNQQAPRKESTKKDANQFKMIEFTEDAKEKVNRHIRISTFVLTIILVYIFFLSYQYISLKPIQSVTVESGILEESGTFEAMVIRFEQNVYATEAGVLDIFLPTGATAKKGEVVCSVSRDIERRNQILSGLSNEKARLTSTIDYDRQTQKKIQSFFREYAINLSYHEFDMTNQVELELKNLLSSGAFGYTVEDIRGYQKVMDNLDVYRQQMDSIGKSYTVEKSSTISYISDGLEDITPESFQPTDLKRVPKPINRLEQTNVVEKDFLFKKIDNLYCYFAAEVDGVAYNYFENSVNSYVNLFFPTKNITLTVRLEKLEPQGGKYIAIFMADRFINRFLEERFLPIEISYNRFNGLKIPNSSITSKTTLLVPKSAVALDDKNDYRIKVKQTDEKQYPEGVAVRIKIYGETKDEYYVLPVDDPLALVKGSVIFDLNRETDKYNLDYVVEREEKMYGVYLLNKGYADFKRIHLLYQSDNFSIVQKMYPYSIRIYDQIASEAHNIKEFSSIR